MRWRTLAVLLPVTVFASSAVFAGDLARVRSLVEDGRPEEALTDLDRHLEEFPVDPEAMFLRALLLAESQREGEARGIFEEVSGLRPDRPEPLNNLAVIQAALGDYDGAVETLKAALRTHAAYRTAYENLTRIYGQLASEAYSRALNVDGAHDRSSLELVLLSDMVLPEVAPIRVELAGGKPLPSKADAASAAMTEPQPAERAVDADRLPGEAEEAAVVSTDEPLVEVAQIPATRDRVVESAMKEGRDADALPSVRAEDKSAGRSKVGVEAEPAELAALVEAWARAWSEQRVEAYLYFYSQGFVPLGDMSRDEWQELRRVRVAAPGYVKVSVAFLDFESGESAGGSAGGSDRALVRFNQSYESDTFGDVVTKTLELVREGGVWKIAKESVDS